MNLARTLLIVAAGALCWSQATVLADTVGTAFMYQGQLKEDGGPADGIYDLKFELYDAVENGTAIGDPIVIADHAFTNGLFAVELDFGAAAFSGEARWLEVSVRPGDSTEDFEPLSPRQPVGVAPYAAYALGGPGVDAHSLDSYGGAVEDVVFVDGAGNVAVGAEVEYGDDLLDQQSQAMGLWVPAAGCSQSFTAGQTGKLRHLVLFAHNLNPQYLRLLTLKVYEGSDSSGRLLGAGIAIVPPNFLGPVLASFEAVGVETGKAYTWESPEGDPYCNLSYSLSNPYPGGQADIDPDADYWFETYVAMPLYATAEVMHITTGGDVGIGTTTPVAQLGLGNYQGGTGNSVVAGHSKQLVLGGEYNTGFNTESSVKLLISDYDNDTDADIYPIYCEDEQNRVDFYVRKQEGSVSTAYFGGNVGIGRDALQPDAQLHVEKPADSQAQATLHLATDYEFGPVVLTSHLWFDGTSIDATSNIEGDTHISLNRNSAGNVKLVEGGGQVHVGPTPAKIVLDPYDGSDGAKVTMKDDTGVATFSIDSHEDGTSGGAFMELRNAAGVTTVELDGDSIYESGTLGLKRSDGGFGVSLIAETLTYRGGSITLNNSEANGGMATVLIDADRLGDGRGWIVANEISTDVLHIAGGSDLSERFDVNAETEIRPGMVVSIDPSRPGKLVVSREVYDRKVAGIISGAGDVGTGLMMGHSGSIADGDHPVALTGRVYCLCDAWDGSIEPGDLLTTSSVPGHAMKVTDHGKAQGAVLGKAMTSLDTGRGLVLVLVSLQ